MTNPQIVTTGKQTDHLEPPQWPHGPIILKAVDTAHEVLARLDTKISELQGLSTEVRTMLDDIRKKSQTGS